VRDPLAPVSVRADRWKCQGLAARRPDLEPRALLDEPRLEATLCQGPAGEDLAALRGRVVSEVMTFVGEAPRGDDITLLLIRRER
jgi:hypothetical protein